MNQEDSHINHNDIGRSNDNNYSSDHISSNNSNNTDVKINDVTRSPKASDRCFLLLKSLSSFSAFRFDEIDRNWLPEMEIEIGEFGSKWKYPI